MKYFPIMEELFESDTIIFLLIGLVIAFLIGIFAVKRPGIGAIVSAAIYAICELLSNLVHNYFFEFIFLFIGTFALGSAAGYVIVWIISKVRRPR